MSPWPSTRRSLQRMAIARRLAVWAAILAGALSSATADEPGLDPRASEMLRKHCLDCHGPDLAEGRINLDELTAAADLGRGFKEWEKVVRMLRQGKMPPKDAPQPSREERDATIAAIEQGLDASIARHAGDPGPVVLRRLTSAEYGYTIADLTGLDLKLERTFVSDAVGAEGFTNTGGAQFLEDATLERYLEAAKAVADHAVIGAGPLSFFDHPGQTGRELSAIARIQQIYRQHGFRTAAGEGAEPFGLDLYPRALAVAWRFHHRAALGVDEATLASLAADEGLSPRLCEHVYQVLSKPATSFPLSAIASQWHDLPRPEHGKPPADLRTKCDRIANNLREWQSVLAAAAGDEEEAAVLTAGEVQVQPSHSLVAEIDWADGARDADLELTVMSASKDAAAGALVVWKNPRIRFQRTDRRRGDYVPLDSVLAPESASRLQFGKHPNRGSVGPHDCVLAGETTATVRLLPPAGTIAARLIVDVTLDTEHGESSIVRCRISDGAVAGETAAEIGATSTLLGDPASPQVAEWQAGVAEFARLLPEVSHREPTPSDRDPIPPPFDNTYNMPERNYFHATIKYHRDDRFLVEHILDDAARRKLDQAWADLLTSFDYHDLWLRFVAKKFALDLGGKAVAELDAATIDRLPAEPRAIVQRLQTEYLAMQQALTAAQPGQLEDAIQFAGRAWRRPLSKEEEQRLRGFYASLRGEGADHVHALRSLLARILVAPQFLFRTEPASVVASLRETSVPLAAQPDQGPGIKDAAAPLSDWELASRLSYFLWSSLPDDELRRAAAAGALHEPDQLAAQARRMLADPKARRLAAEFFGQWLGFYRFDEYRGIDAARFPEFDESLRAALHDEAVGFFEHIVRADRPIAEILTADYTFLNAPLARHYGLDGADLPEDRLVRVADLAGDHRGGLLGLGAVLAATSAPLRTSAVKRGDWVLRRVLGTPVPPPPADAGSIAADDALPDGLTVRQRLEAHRTNRTCVNCHARIDPLGFALENYDPLGRWRRTYRDGRPIDTSGTLSDGTEIQGLDGLRAYLRSQQPQLARNLCGKLLGYALGRGEMASDRPLLQQMVAASDGPGGEGKFSGLVISIVTSRQFRYRRQ